MRIKTGFLFFAAITGAATLLFFVNAASDQRFGAVTAQSSGRMTNLDRNKQLAREFYVPFNTGKVEKFDFVLAENWVEYPPAAPDQNPGREGYKPVITNIRQVLPDLKVDIQDLIAEEDKVVVRSILSATPKAEFLGVAPTGKKFSIMTIDIYRIANNRIVETWHVEDFTDAIKQLKAADETPKKQNP